VQDICRSGHIGKPRLTIGGKSTLTE
jgi:hypothetical protein